MQNFYLYGLVVRSELNIVYLPKIENGNNPDITIKINNNLVSKLNNNNASETINFLNVNDAFIENKFFICLIKEGKSIQLKVKVNIDDLNFISNFLHMPFAFILFQRGILPLHAMSFELNNKSILISGNSGSGKSTLCSLIQSKYKILSEDITGISFENDELKAIPSFPIILSDNFYKQKLRFFGNEKINRSRKIIKLENDSFCSTLETISKIYILEWGNQFDIQSLNSSESFKYLIRNSFKPSPHNNCVKSDKLYFKKIAEIINKLKIFRFTRPYDFSQDDYCAFFDHANHD